MVIPDLSAATMQLLLQYCYGRLAAMPADHAQVGHTSYDSSLRTAFHCFGKHERLRGSMLGLAWRQGLGYQCAPTICDRLHTCSPGAF